VIKLALLTISHWHTPIKRMPSSRESTKRSVATSGRSFFDSIDLASYRTSLPFVQRIINASVHTSTGASPASLLYDNKVMLDKGILLPPPEVPTARIPTSTKVADMILTQGTLMAQAATRLRTADDTHLATHSVAITTFAVNSFVLIQYSSTPPTRIHTKWE
jgi:hypothetical protein